MPAEEYFVEEGCAWEWVSQFYKPCPNSPSESASCSANEIIHLSRLGTRTVHCMLSVVLAFLGCNWDRRRDSLRVVEGL
jgi:hypothetical protein